MEIPIHKLGDIVEQYYKLGYFNNDSLESAIKKMEADLETTIGITLQHNENEAEENSRVKPSALQLMLCLLNHTYFTTLIVLYVGAPIHRLYIHKPTEG
ncbi:hypothetical protein [Enterococcus sp. CWB-B31]|uniref:hypothetical protein n=1 Tax=Enterococcus sp. CWB-B31 TaxID=2885159 RepID=UPI001E400172|nr:hypothetical protein [Enterococcus sp. CWB-B31]MCB5955625.1 hypothetical protein [Enterococcus sp. CWB-B31]